MKPECFIVFLLFLLFSISAYAQHRKLTDEQLNKSTFVTWIFADDTTGNCEKMDALFRKDVANGTVFIFFMSGIAPVIYPGDAKFQNKYNVNFEDFGCTGPRWKCLLRYNYDAFDYLTGLYGKKWFGEIRRDAPGLKQWKRQWRKKKKAQR